LNRLLAPAVPSAHSCHVSAVVRYVQLWGLQPGTSHKGYKKNSKPRVSSQWKKSPVSWDNFNYGKLAGQDQKKRQNHKLRGLQYPLIGIPDSQSSMLSVVHSTPSTPSSPQANSELTPPILLSALPPPFLSLCAHTLSNLAFPIGWLSGADKECDSEDCAYRVWHQIINADGYLERQQWVLCDQISG